MNVNSLIVPDAISMRVRLKVDMRVVYCDPVGHEYVGKYAGKVLGFFGNSDVIVLLPEPSADGDLARVIHESVLMEENT